MGAHRRQGRRDEGVSLVEFALVLPVLLMLLLGLISAGFALNEKQQMNHAAREGARFATTVAPSQFPSNWADEIQKVVDDEAGDTLELDQICVSLVTGSSSDGDLEVYSNEDSGQDVYTTQSDGSSPCISPQDYPVTDDDNGLRVQVTTSRPAEIQLGLFGTIGVTLEEDATARSEFDG